uniref:Uncharacterized protein n=1 Tax=Panagrolaimus davidi TaxID=227884 RepID=A0A914PTI3_9BILA
MKILAETEREFKIGYCSLRNIDGMIDDENYYQFMRKNAVKEAQFFVQFDENDVTTDNAKKFGVSVKCKNFYSKDPNPKPFFSYCV